jgi:SEC-C motif-containing protein
MMMCPCSPDKKYADCCEKFLTGITYPTTLEELMRSRYSAYATANIDYIIKTMAGTALAEFNESDAENDARTCHFTHLTLHGAFAEDGKHFVEFSAHYYAQNKQYVIHECSEFALLDGKWMYVNGEGEEDRSDIGRNDSCPCGSGKKFKKCCLE